MVLGNRLDASFGDSLNGCFRNVHESHVGLVVNLVVTRLHRNASRTESVVLGNQLFGDIGVSDAFADLHGDEFREFGIRFGIHQRVLEISDPNPKTWRVIKSFPEGFSLLRIDIQRAARIDIVIKPAGCLAAPDKNFVVAFFYIRHFLSGYGRVIQRRAPVWPPLEYSK